MVESSGEIVTKLVGGVLDSIQFNSIQFYSYSTK